MAGGGCSDTVLKVTKTKDFAYRLMDQFQAMKDQQFLTDFILKVDDKEITCHKNVLAARSEYFRRLFSHKDTLEVTQGFTNFPTLHFPALKLAVEYCYSGILECNMDDATQVIEVAEHLQIFDLKTVLSDLIVNHLTADNSIGWYVVAKLYDMTPVIKRAHEMMSMDFSNVVHSPEFLALDFDDLINYIIWQHMDHSISLIAAAKWIMHDCEHRQRKFLNILNIINISQCSASALKYIVTKYGPNIIFPSPDVSQMFFNAAFSDAPVWQDPGPWAGYSILALGGMGSGGTLNRQSWMINLKTGETIAKASLPSEIKALYVPAICNTPKGVLFAGGASRVDDRNLKDPSTQCIIYQKADNNWAILPELPAGVLAAAAICQDQKVYVIGGSGPFRKKMNCLDLTTSAWYTCPDLLQGLLSPIVGCVGHNIYVTYSTFPENGLTKEGITLQCFDSSTSSWSFKSKMPDSVKKTHGASAVALDHRLFVLGGPKICLSYDTREDAWTILTPPLNMHLVGAAVYLKGKIILCGGDNERKEPSDTIESYDPATNTWALLPVKLPKSLSEFGIIPA